MKLEDDILNYLENPSQESLKVLTDEIKKCKTLESEPPFDDSKLAALLLEYKKNPSKLKELTKYLTESTSINFSGMDELILPTTDKESVLTVLIDEYDTKTSLDKFRTKLEDSISGILENSLKEIDTELKVISYQFSSGISELVKDTMNGMDKSELIYTTLHSNTFYPHKSKVDSTYLRDVLFSNANSDNLPRYFENKTMDDIKTLQYEIFKRPIKFNLTDIINSSKDITKNLKEWISPNKKFIDMNKVKLGDVYQGQDNKVYQVIKHEPVKNIITVKVFTDLEDYVTGKDSIVEKSINFSTIEEKFGELYKPNIIYEDISKLNPGDEFQLPSSSLIKLNYLGCGIVNDKIIHFGKVSDVIYQIKLGKNELFSVAIEKKE